MKIQRIKLPAHGDYQIKCGIGTRREFCKFMRKKHNSVLQDDRKIEGEYIKLFQGECEIAMGVLFLDTRVRRKRRIRVLVHESLHVAQGILNILHIDVSADRHESLAYLQDYIFDVIYQKNIKFFAPKRKKK